MTPNELRIGNWVRYANKPHRIEQILRRNGNYALCFEDLHHGIWIEHAEPIELTEEMLLKCGFSDRDYKDYKDYIDYIDGYIGIDLRSGDIKHLHQFQNIFFDLTNKELEVEL